MKKTILLILFIVLTVAGFVIYCIIDSTLYVETNPEKYLDTNRYVARDRDLGIRNFQIHKDFLPSTIQDKKILNYLYWDNRSRVNLTYGITVTIEYPSVEQLSLEADRIRSLPAFNEECIDDKIVMTYLSSTHELKEYFEDPCYDGIEYRLEYAIISISNQTIIYGETLLMEGGFIHEDFLEQIKLLNKMVEIVPNPGNCSQR